MQYLSVWYIGHDMEGRHTIREQFELENKAITISTQVWWLAIRLAIRDRKQNREVAPSMVVFVVKGSRAAQGLVKKGIKVAGVWYQVKTYTNAVTDSRCELCCGWGNIKNKYGSKPMCGYCSGHHWTSDHMCNMVGCTAQQGSLRGHTLEKCPNCKGNDFPFSSRCMEKTEATRVAQHCVSAK